MRAIERSGKNYLAVIKGLAAEESSQGTAWLQTIVDDTLAAASAVSK
jgi:hypothetical protein